MPLPRLGHAEIEWVVQQVLAYIERQRQDFIPRAVPLGLNQKIVMEPFFAKRILESSRLVVLYGERVGNPPFYGALLGMGFEAGSLPDFAQMTAITYVDTIVSHEPFTETLLFHELVHVVQYEKLGLPGFAAKCVSGFLTGGSYEAIPLEVNAYGLDARFAAASRRGFSVEAEVEAWIDAGRF